MKKIILLSALLMPMSASAGWESPIKQNGPIHFDQYRDEHGGPRVCRLTIGAEEKNKKPQIVLIGDRKRGTDEFTVLGSYAEVDACYFSVRVDRGKNFQFGSKYKFGVDIGSADMSFVDALLNAKKALYIMVRPIGKNVKEVHYVYRLNPSKDLKPHVQNFINCVSN